MTFTERFKPVVTKADKAVLGGYDQTVNLPQFDLLFADGAKIECRFVVRIPDRPLLHVFYYKLYNTSIWVCQVYNRL